MIISIPKYKILQLLKKTIWGNLKIWVEVKFNKKVKPLVCGYNSNED